MKQKPELIPAYPKAACMLEALRGLGYTPKSAVADVIDNSLSAGATEIHVDTFTPEHSLKQLCLAITDDGSGMTKEELIRAMSPGIINPTEPRDTNDLGRFGMGLKTASLSQCRKLTVFSKKNGEAVCLCWDLDSIQNYSDNDGWNLLPGQLPEWSLIQQYAESMEHGTIVIWEKTDRLCPDQMTERDFYDVMDRIKKYLRLFFHRFMERQNNKVRFVQNGFELRPINPFFPELATERSPRQRIQRGPWFQSFILPHKDKLKPQVYDDCKMLNGWKAHEGFYVYRNDRLLMAGGWLGLGYYSKDAKRWIPDELHQQLRIQLDISSQHDSAWKIDIKKSTASPPPAIRRELTLLTEQERDKARKSFVYRGEYQNYAQAESTSVWKVVETKHGVAYRIDKNHPLVCSLSEALGDQADKLKSLLTIIEDNVPVQKIYLDAVTGARQDQTGMEDETRQHRLKELREKFLDMQNLGYTPEEACRILKALPAFYQWAELIDQCCSTLLGEQENR